MKKMFISLFILFFAFYCYADETEDLYGWMMDAKVKDFAVKVEKFRRETKNRMFFSGEANYVFFYHPPFIQADSNSHAAEFAYDEKDYRDPKYYNDGQGGYKASSWGAIDTGAYGKFSFSTTLIDTDLPLISANRLTIDFNWNYYWMQGDAGAGITFAPVPFYYASAGGSIGSGWEWLWTPSGSPILFGMGLNERTQTVSKPFLGPVIKAFITNGIQMDFSALPMVPQNMQRWTHFIITANISIQYQELVNVKGDVPYHYLISDYQLNGWNLNSGFIIGYLIPVIEDKKINFQSFRRLFTREFSIFPLLNVKVGSNLTHFNDSKMKDGGWGSDFISVVLNPMLIFNLPNNYSINLYFEFSNSKRFSEGTLGNKYYFDKKYEDWIIGFATAGVVWTWRF